MKIAYAYSLALALACLHADALQSRSTDLDTSQAKGSGNGNKFATHRSVGNDVPLTDHGYNLVASLKSDTEMSIFVRRLLDAEARYVVDTGGLMGIVSYYSGTVATQDLTALKAELRKAPWVGDGVGRSVPLSEDGYQRVAKLESRAHMKAFARRIVSASNGKIMDEGALNGIVPYFDGESSVQSFDALKNELLSAPWVSSSEAARTSALQQKLRSAEHVSSSEAARNSEGVVTQRDAETQEEVNEDEDLQMAFEGYDLDRDGRLNHAELKAALNSFEREFSDEAVEEMLREADTDGNGELDLAEFQAKMKS